MAFRVLIADDSPAMRLVIRRVVQLSGFAVDAFIEAADGEQALRALGRQPVDVVLTGIDMPNVNGEQLLVALQGDQRLREIPVIVVSREATRRRIHHLRKLGARGFVTKLFQPQTLRHEMERVLGVSQA
jgi:two-component system, chemotaxis family, chemotaxis protein CheY